MTITVLERVKILECNSALDLHEMFKVAKRVQTNKEMVGLFESKLELLEKLYAPLTARVIRLEKALELEDEAFILRKGIKDVIAMYLSAQQRVNDIPPQVSLQMLGDAVKEMLEEHGFEVSIKWTGKSFGVSKEEGNACGTSAPE